MALFWMAGGNYGQEGQREIIAAVSVAVFALGISYSKTTFLSRAVIIGVWLVAVVIWVLLKGGD
jgi:asparagine N-glycosylation enzyme membrane subunit Stt3